MSMLTFAPDVVSRLSPLGIRLWDFVTQTAISDGVTLAVQGAGGPAPVRIVTNPSGVFVLGGLPGLAAVESSAGGSALRASPPEAAQFTIEVDHTRGRFLPFSLSVSAPTQGISVPACATDTWMPSMQLPAIPLFSGPARPVPAGLAAVRAQLWDTIADAPAAYAMLEIDPGTAPAQRGLADASGRVLVVLPYPPLATTLTSPPALQALTAQSWLLTPTVYYAAAAAGSGTSGHPDLCTLLAQSVATAPASSSPPSTPSTEPLLYGVDLVLVTPGESTLLIDPGAAP